MLTLEGGDEKEKLRAVGDEIARPRENVCVRAEQEEHLHEPVSLALVVAWLGFAVVG